MEISLENLFDSPRRIRVIKFFIRNSNIFSAKSEIAKTLQISSSLLEANLKNLILSGFLKTKKIKSQKVFSLNEKFPLLEELRQLIKNATPTNEKKLAEKIAKTGQIKLVIVAGVFINSESSRADVLIIGDRMQKNKLTKLLKNLSAEIGKELEYTVMSTKDFRYREDMFDRFLRDILEFPHKKLINKLKI